MSNTTTATSTTATAVFPADLPVADFPALVGKWSAPAGQYLDHTHPSCIMAAFAYYASTGLPVSTWGRSVGFQSSGQIKAAMNRVLRANGQPSFTRQAAALVLASQG